MNRFIANGTVISLCFFALTTVGAQESDKRPPSVERPAQVTTAKSTPNISFDERLLATIPPGFGDPVVAGLVMEVREKAKKVEDILKLNPRPAVFLPSSNTDFLVQFFLGNPVGKLSASYATATIFGSGTQVTNIYSDGQKVFLVSGNEKGREFDGIGFLFVSPDLNTIGYVGVEGTGEKERAFLVVGRKTIPIPEDETIRQHQVYNPEELKEWPPLFSLDGKKVAFVMRRKPLKDGKEYVAVVEGDWNDPIPAPIKNGPEFDDVVRPVFSPDGAILAYEAKLNNKWFIVTGDKKGPEFNNVGLLIFSPDGRTVGYAAKKGSKWLLVVGDKEGPEFDDVSDPVFSPDGKTVAYAAGEGKKHFIVVGDKRSPEFDGVMNPVFSPNGGRVAYQARRGKKAFIVVGDKPGPQFDYAGEPVFSADGTTVAYAAVEHEKGFIVVGDKKGPEFFAVVGDAILFGKDAGTVIYGAQQNKGEKIFVRVGDKKVFGTIAKVFLMMGDKRGPEVDELRTPVLSADRTTVAYTARRGDKWFVVAGDKQGPEFDWIGNDLYFSPDGTKVAYGAERIKGVKQMEYWWKVMDVR